MSKEEQAPSEAHELISDSIVKETTPEFPHEYQATPEATVKPEIQDITEQGKDTKDRDRSKYGKFLAGLTA